MPGNLPGQELTGRQRRPAGARNLAFDADTLAGPRKAVLAVAAAAGLPEERADEAMLAVHEVAANAVRHGGGTGRLQIEVATGYLRCRVSDTGPGSLNGLARGDGRDPALPWPFQPGHGLWLVRNVADHLSIQSSLRGSRVTVAFRLPDSADSRAGA